MNDENINNEQQSIIEENAKNDNKNSNISKISDKSKTRKILKILLVVFCVILVLIVTLFGLYKSLVDISSKNESKFDYISTSETNNQEYKLTDFLGYNSKTNPDVLRVKIPKQHFYNRILGINELIQQINNDYDIQIHRLGTVSNATGKDLVDFCADISYKNTINAYISGTIRYEFNSLNGIDIYLEKFVIGDGVPMFLYRDFLPFKDGDMIAEISADNYELLKYKALNLKYVDNVVIDSSNLNFEFKYMENIENIAKYKFGDQADSFTDIMKNVFPIVMEMTFGDNKEEFKDLSETYIPYIIQQIFE